MTRKRVYPRVYGGTSRARVSLRRVEGLSPRVRGNPPASGGSRCARRSIPACTGEPLRLHSTTGEKPVYPRVYGGTRRRQILVCTPTGLSPRVRGNLVVPLAGAADLRSIPACTGEPPSRPGTPSVEAVYPRVYGGTGRHRHESHRLVGLSPRVRGNLTDDFPLVMNVRSIPACTGEPMQSVSTSAAAWVYPRVYGGTELDARKRLLGNGLSPRVRGNRPGLGRPLPRRGSIPACTGEPPACRPRPRFCTVYPRVYGGTSDPAASCNSCKGLSPRVRGNRSAANHRSAPSRSIPACTGEPHARRPHRIHPQVYPRVYGGTSSVLCLLTQMSGLSPRVRGNPAHGRRARSRPRSIPACTGEPEDRKVAWR